MPGILSISHLKEANAVLGTSQDIERNALEMQFFKVLFNEELQLGNK